MARKEWWIDFGEDSLEVVAGEVEELENDELSMAEAGFLQGYGEDFDLEET